MASFPYTPFPFNVTPASPAFQLSSLASDLSQGWVPSCFTPECVPTASWSTSLVGAEMSFEFWGWDVAFDGNVKGNMNIELLWDGRQAPWDPSEGTLFNVYGQLNADLYLHNITLRVLDASSDAELTINQARVNGSTLMSALWNWDRWMIPSNDTKLSYTGFVQQTNPVQAGFQTTHISSKAGDIMSTQFNGSALLIYGPCGPANGLMKVTIDGREATVNTSQPIQSDDCLLFQSWGCSGTNMHELLVENVNGAILGINRIEFFWSYEYRRGHGAVSNTALVAAIISIVLFISGVAGCMVYLKMSKQRGKLGQIFI